MIQRGLNPRFLEVGKIKIGGKGEKRKAKGGKEYRLPVRYGHFVVTTTERGGDDNFIINKEIMEKLGKEPRELSIRLPFDSIDTNFHTAFKYYAGRRCICTGDGVKASRLLGMGETTEVECNPETCEFLQGEKCKVTGILSCFLPYTMDFGGIYRFRTHSWNSVSGILASLQYYQEQTGGILQGLPLKLVMVKKTTEEHGTVDVVTLVLDGIQLNKMRQLAVIEREQRERLKIDMVKVEMTAIQEGFLVDNDHPGDIQDEFYPDPEPVPAEKGDSPQDIKEKIVTTRPEEPEKQAEPKELF